MNLLLNPRIQPLTIHSGDGCYVFDGEGRRYLDLVSGIGVNALGHNYPQMISTLVEQAGRCIHTSGLYGHPYQAELAHELCALAGLDRALFTNSGTEGTEAAIKLALCHGAAHQKTEFVALEGSFHGRSRGGLALAGQAHLHNLFSPYGLQVTFIPRNDEAALRAAIGPHTAALVLEPVQGEGGVHLLSENYLRAAREFTARHGALLIADECQSGLGRTGAAFAYQWSGIQPDIATIAKPLAGGLPLAAVLFTDAVAATFPLGTHASTFAGGPLACRLALEFLDVLRSLMPTIRATGDHLRSGLDALAARHPAVSEVRGRGLMLGIELDQPGDSFVRFALDRGLLINCTQQNVLRLLPPYILTAAQADEALTILDEVLMTPRDQTGALREIGLKERRKLRFAEIVQEGD